MQELWAIKLHWDDELPANQQKTWTIILQSLNSLEDIKIPRWLGTFTKSIIELHGFSDASQLAMSAVVYILTRHNDQVTTTLLCSKTKVAPLKRLTIPRLELSAAVLLTKLLSQCITTLQLETAPCYMWTDSTITFTWIKNHPSKWKEFIHNRVCLIQETLPHAQWRHVPGEQNPADCASRGVTSAELTNHPLWWTGPAWLHDDPITWPKPPTTKHDQKELEMKNSSTVHVLHTSTSLKQWELLYRYSSYQRLIRITAICWRVINQLRRKSTIPPSSPLTPEELDHATKTLGQTNAAIQVHERVIVASTSDPRTA
ncbi:uncharacterized protein [Chelonus insularis]|uniref:uncharacterized protein n=1 Tax=Chelonus insularis TaxID=460826 RepID=UPI001589332E|nr:uncharacterized protein LOC118070504 [Chelonus insularis]